MFSVKIGAEIIFSGILHPRRFRTQTNQEVLWDANRELVAVNPRLTNRSCNRATNNVILTPS